MDEKSFHSDKNEIDFTLFITDTDTTLKYIDYFENKKTFYLNCIDDSEKIKKIAEKIKSKTLFYILKNKDPFEIVKILHNLYVKDSEYYVCIDEILLKIKNAISFYELLIKYFILHKTKNMKFFFILNKKSITLHKYYYLFKKFNIQEIIIK